MLDKKYFQIIKKHYPKITEKQLNIFDDGWDFLVVLANDKIVFRFPRRKDYESKLPFEVEFISQFTSVSPIAIPKLKLHKDFVIGNYVTYQFIPGVQFKRQLATTFSKDKQLLIASQLGDFLTAIHSFSVDAAKKMGIAEVNSLKSWTERFEKIKILVFPYLNQKQQQWTTQIFTQFISLIRENPIHNTVTHSDMMPEHIIVNPETQSLSGIIDFGDMVIADPAYDFTFLNKYGQDFLEAAYKTYGLSRDKYFEVRRQFYEDRLVVTNLEHSVREGDPYWIEKHKNEFGLYLEKQQGIQLPK